MKKRLKNAIVHVPVCILLVYISLNVVSFWTAQERELLNNYEDDAYFYFEIAKNIVELDQSTFDGHTITNGYHPLWLLILLPLSYFIHDQFLFLRVLGTLSALASGATTFVGFLYLRNRYSFISYSLAAALMLTCTIAFGSTGMETTILIPLMTTALLLLSRIKPWNTLPESHNAHKDWLVLGIVLSLVQLARLDAILFNIAVLALMLFIDQSSRKWEHIAITSLPILMSGGIYLIVNYVSLRHIIPTSGVAKSMGEELINMRFIKQLTNPMNPEGTLWNIYFCMAFLAVAYVICFARSKWYVRRELLPNGRYYLALVASVFFLLFTGYQILGTSWVLWRWYGYPIYLMSIFVVPLVVERMLIHLNTYQNLGLLLRAMNNLTTIVTIAVMLIIGIRWGYWRKPVSVLFAYENYLIAEELNQHFQEPVVFAMGDRAGSFSYFFDGDVLQLEGLVGDYSVIQAIQKNTLMEYMTEFGVQYVMTHVAPPSSYTRWKLLTPLPKHSSGPHAEIYLCKDSEFLHRETEFGPIYIWEWPSCDR
jgi:hypothetical protein